MSLEEAKKGAQSAINMMIEEADLMVDRCKLLKKECKDIDLEDHESAKTTISKTKAHMDRIKAVELEVHRHFMYFRSNWLYTIAIDGNK